MPRERDHLWLVSRLLILTCFGIVPLFETCERAKTAPIRSAAIQCNKAFDEMLKYPVLSEGWNTNKAAAEYWLGEEIRLYNKHYGVK